MKDRIRVGVVGCGQFMSRQHIQTVARSDALLLAHLADRDEHVLRAVADRYEPAKVSSNWQSVVEDPEVDVVVVGILPSFHPAVAKGALVNGKPVYVEKPLTDVLQEGKEIRRLSLRTNRPVAVGFNRRFAPAVQLVERGFRQSGGPFTVLYRICDDDRIRPPAQQWKKADRLLIETVHIFDLLCYLIGSEPVRVFAVETRPNDALVTVSYEDGSNATILSSSWGSLSQPKERLEAVLDRSTVEMDDFVETRFYGDIDLPERTCFAGRPYDGCDNRHVEAFQRDGMAAMIELRGRYYQAMRSSGVLEEGADQSAWSEARRLLGEPPLPQINYAPDKGWGPALEEFCIGALGGGELRNAGAIDGNRASACALAARRSIETNEPVSLRREDYSDPDEAGRSMIV